MTSTANDTRHERASATRQRIIAAARELFIARGYRSVSLREIAQEAGISHPGLLGHFGSKEQLLAEVVAEFEAANEAMLGEIIAAAEPGELLFRDVAARNAATPGYLALFTALTGEASSLAHPSHARMRARYARLRELSTDMLSEAQFHGVIAPDRDVVAEGVRHIAGWDGLQLMAQYLPDRVDVADMLEDRESLWSTPFGWRDGAPPARGPAATQLPSLMIGDDAPPADPGYAPGRRRRAQILADASRLFAREGFGDTSLQDIARAAGVSKSTLLHHYPSKDALLEAVLVERDRRIRERSEREGPARAVELLRDLGPEARRAAEQEPGLIEVYAVLSCEGVPPSHPAHAYFARRFERGIATFTELFRLAQQDGDLPEHRDPEHEAIWLLALWDGLQYQWLYDRDAVDVGTQLSAHIDDVLPRET